MTAVVACLAIVALFAYSPGVLGAVQAPPSSVFQSVSSKMHALEARLSELEVENRRKLAKHEEDYEHKIESLHEDNLKIAADNMNLIQELEDLKQQIITLRRHAMSLKNENDAVTRDLEVIRSNLSTALEFTNGSLIKLDDENSAEMRVLRELEEADQKRGAREERRAFLDDIQAGRLALLQTVVSDDPKDLLKVLDSGIHDLAVDYKRNEAALDRKFAAALKKESDRHTSLLAEQSTLRSTKTVVLKLKERLGATIVHMEEKRKNLKDLGTSVRLYSQKLSLRPMPDAGLPADKSADDQHPITDAVVASSRQANQPLARQEDADADDHQGGHSSSHELSASELRHLERTSAEHDLYIRSTADFDEEPFDMVDTEQAKERNQQDEYQSVAESEEDMAESSDSEVMANLDRKKKQGLQHGRHVLKHPQARIHDHSNKLMVDAPQSRDPAQQLLLELQYRPGLEVDTNATMDVVREEAKKKEDSGISVMGSLGSWLTR